jgi:hypothetical protein
MDTIKALEDALVAIERVGDPSMWRNLNGELVWRGETPDGNEIETQDPRQILFDAEVAARSALLAAKQGVTWTKTDEFEWECDCAQQHLSFPEIHPSKYIIYCDNCGGKITAFVPPLPEGEGK